jgi:protocatechuate 3,4-dioxygenase beta subunit
MRGTQFTAADGTVEFSTVYPGWYPGRTPHIHVKVFLDETTLLTGQLFFPDDVSDAVYGKAAPYNARTDTGRTRNEGDGIARRAGTAAMATVEELPDAYLVQMIIGVERLGQFGGMSYPASNA